MSNSDNLKQLQERLSSVKAGIQESLKIQAELEKKNLYLNIGIAVVIVGFMFAGYATLKCNFEPNKVQESLVTQGPEMVASVGEAVSEAAAEVIPVYYTEVQNKSVEVLPEVSEVLEREIALLGDETSKQVKDELTKALERVEAKQREGIKANFPDLKDEEIQKLLDEAMKDAETEIEGLAGYILSKTVGDIITLDKTIKAFDTKNLPDKEHELSRQLMHNFLLLLDDELMEMDLEAPASDKSVAPDKKTKGAK